jgi:hypothetical protein
LVILMFMLMLQMLCLIFQLTRRLKTKIGTRIHTHKHIHACRRLRMCCFLCMTMRANSSPQFRRKNVLCWSLTLGVLLSRSHSPSLAALPITLSSLKKKVYQNDI